MPEGYTHVRAAKKAAAAIHYKVKCPQAFAAGANGPDSLFCYQILKKPAKRLFDLPKFGNRMHEEKTGLFLQNLLRHVKTRAQVEYALGFLSHYAMDTVVHPYVVAVSAKGQPYGGKGGHGYFEIALDSTLHAEDTGVSQVAADDTSPLMPPTDLAEVCAVLHAAIADTYAVDVPVEYLADAFYDIYRCRRLFTSRRGLRKAGFAVLETLMGKRGFITSHVTPRTLKTDLPDTWTNPFTGEEKTGGAFALLKEGQTRSEQFMSGALQNWVGVLSDADLHRLLGSMSYTEGRATALSDPDFVPPEPEKAEETAETADEKTQESAEPKTDEKSAEKAETVTEKPEEKSPEKAETTDETKAEATEEKPADPPAEKAEAEPAEAAPETPAEKSEETKPDESPAEKPNEAAPEKSPEKPEEKSPEKPPETAEIISPEIPEPTQPTPSLTAEALPQDKAPLTV